MTHPLLVIHQACCRRVSLLKTLAADREEGQLHKRQDTGDLVKFMGAIAIFTVMFTTVAAFFNLAP